MVSPVLLVSLLLVASCVPTAAVPGPLAHPEAASARVEPFPYPAVWTTASNQSLAGDRSGSVSNLFTRLEVIGRYPAGLLVRCSVCEVVLEGVVDEATVLTTALPPGIAAWGTLSEFLLSIRQAAERRDLGALRSVMARDFTFAFLGVQTPETALVVWRAEEFRDLDLLPDLLDRGVASIDGRIWSAPTAFVTDPSFRGLRFGVQRRPDGRWEWLYLIRGIGSDR